MKEKIEELEKGDLLWVRFGYDLKRAVYLGKRVARINFGGFFADLDGREWIYRRDRLWKLLKNYFCP